MTEQVGDESSTRHPFLEFGSGPLADVDLTSPRLHAERDLSDVWGMLRERQPVAWHPTTGGGFWVVSSYSAAAEVYRNSEVYTSSRGNVLAMLLAGGDPAGGKMLPVSDGPRHQQIRRVLMRALTPRALTGLAERVRLATVRLVREAVESGDCDLGRDVVPYLPLAVICDLLMVPEDDRELLLTQSKLALASEDPDGTEFDARLARNEILLYFAKLARSRQDQPGDDILGLLIQMTRSEVALTSQELLYNAYSILLGGDETTRLSMIGAAHALTQWPDEWNRLKTGAVPVETAVEEFLRWTTPTLHAGRTATSDTTLGGRHIARDDIVTVWNSSANFDPRQFDDPARLRLDRTPNRHLSFAVGAHFCLGAQLARIELGALVGALVETADGIELTGEPKRLYSNFLSGFTRLPVRFEAAARDRQPSNQAEKEEVR
ncbi:cytochrome P450 [Saccharothrix ecbatanensis]|uniref:Cytochrome P450 n=1 Tax=Saccharothrix ecbatanensis TaxID=1105145 RepID=A0A7W9M0M9_9PSEU|nr:cytochrome P450 [Saccharothrix ecbatanensis]MBB5802963.1 cytochrome P450 [Saccharothrix ecbatanensis]